MGLAMLPHLAKAARILFPASKTELAFSLLPDLYFAGAAAAGQPENTSFGTRLGAAAEDFLGSQFLGMFGRGGGYGAGRLVGLARGGRVPSPENMSRLMGAGEMAASLGGYGFMPRPFANAALEDYNRRVEEQQRIAQAARDEQVRQQALAEAGGFGSMMPPSLAGAYLSSPLAGGFG